MDETTWPAEWVRGALPTWVLSVLARGPAHGYALAQHLRAAGVAELRGGALYPVLNRLEQDGAITSTWTEGDGGPGRKVFELTDAGRTRLAHLTTGWQGFAATTAALLADATEPRETT